jgi:hypothetical protein
MPIGGGGRLIVAGGTGGAPPFNPTDEPGMLWWYNSENVNTVLGDVDQYRDISGFGNDSDNAPSAGQRPTINFGDPQYNGVASNSWSNAANTAIRSALVTYGPFTLFLVAKVLSNTSYVWASTTADYLYSQTSFSSYVAAREGPGASGYDHPAGANWAVSASPRTFTRTFDGTHAGDTLHINGALQALVTTIATDPGVATAAARVHLLTYISNTFSSDATFGAAILYDHALTGVVRGKVEAFLRAYYAHY